MKLTHPPQLHHLVWLEHQPHLTPPTPHSFPSTRPQTIYRKVCYPKLQRAHSDYYFFFFKWYFILSRHKIISSFHLILCLPCLLEYPSCHWYFDCSFINSSIHNITCSGLLLILIFNSKVLMGYHTPQPLEPLWQCWAQGPCGHSLVYAPTLHHYATLVVYLLSDNVW